MINARDRIALARKFEDLDAEAFEDIRQGALRLRALGHFKEAEAIAKHLMILPPLSNDALERAVTDCLNGGAGFVKVTYLDPNEVRAAPQSAPAQPVAGLSLTGAQLLEALDFIAPDRATDAEQLESEVTIQHGPGHSGPGMYCWCTDYPDEGSFLLDGAAAPPAAERDVPRALTDEQRQALGVALTNYFTAYDEGEDHECQILSTWDYHDARNIDHLIDRVIVPALTAAGAK